MRAEAGLTQRETQIAELLAWGAAKKEVADRLSISPRTVENTARNIYSKIGGKSSVSCPLKPSDSAPLKHSTMPP